MRVQRYRIVRENELFRVTAARGGGLEPGKWLGVEQLALGRYNLYTSLGRQRQIANGRKRENT